MNTQNLKSDISNNSKRSISMILLSISSEAILISPNPDWKTVELLHCDVEIYLELYLITKRAILTALLFPVNEL